MKSAFWIVVVAAAAALAGFSVSGQAIAQTQQQRDWCYDDKATDAQTIDGCTALITVGNLRGRDLAIVLYDRGLSYENTNKNLEAMADFSQAIALDPNYPDAFDDRGNIYSKGGDFDHAIADYDQAIRLKPNFELAFSNRGYNYYRKGDFDRAIQDLDHSIQLNDKVGRTFVNRALVYVAKHDCVRALLDYQSAKKLNWNFTLSDETRKECGSALSPLDSP